MSTHALWEAEPPSPASVFRHLGLSDLHALHALLSAGADAVLGRLAQPRVSENVEHLLIEAIRPINQLADDIIAEVRTRMPASRREAQMKTELVVGFFLGAGEIEEAAEAAAEIVRAWRGATADELPEETPAIAARNM
jgi:hypothetical protein